MNRRMELLQKQLAETPDDAFSRYALGMEMAKAGDLDAALAQWAEVIARDPSYVPAYQMSGQHLMEDGRFEEAEVFFTQGVEQARASGNAKATAEMTDFLNEVELLRG